MINQGSFNKAEKSLLLFLEDCIVNQSGKINLVHTNKEDRAILERWKKEKLIWFGRIKFEDIMNEKTHCVIFSDNAWELSAIFRKERGLRQLKNSRDERGGYNNEFDKYIYREV